MSDEKPKLGPTGRYPRGMARPDDTGETRIAIYAEGGNVCIDMGVPTKWLAFPPDVALEMARVLEARARELML
jgi:hypothetical protein